MSSRSDPASIGAVAVGGSSHTDKNLAVSALTSLANSFSTKQRRAATIEDGNVSDFDDNDRSYECQYKSGSQDIK